MSDEPQILLELPGSIVVNFSSPVSKWGEITGGEPAMNLNVSHSMFWQMDLLFQNGEKPFQNKTASYDQLTPPSGSSGISPRLTFSSLTLLSFNHFCVISFICFREINLSCRFCYIHFLTSDPDTVPCMWWCAWGRCPPNMLPFLMARQSKDLLTRCKKILGNEDLLWQMCSFLPF